MQRTLSESEALAVGSPLLLHTTPTNRPGQSELGCLFGSSVGSTAAARLFPTKHAEADSIPVLFNR